MSTSRAVNVTPQRIAALWPAIGATLVAFWRVRRRAGWLLIPYLAWVSYAASLNWAMWRLNE